MSETTALHVAIILGCTALAVIAIIVISVRLSRPQTGRHARVVAADPVWGNLAEHDEAFDAALRDEFPDPAATDDVRSAWMQAPVRAATGGRPPWDSQQFPAISQTEDQSWNASTAASGYDDAPAEAQPAPATVTPAFTVPTRAIGAIVAQIRTRTKQASELRLLPDFPDGADMPAAGERLAVAVSRGGGEPSNLPGPDSCDQIAVTTPNAAPQGSTEPSPCKSGHEIRAGEPVLEGRIVLAPVLGYIDGLALTSTYYERIEQIGVQARVLALAAAA